MKKAFMGLRLKRLREEQRLTQAALAQRLGISLSYLNQLENNQRPLTVQVLLALNTAFGLDLQTFSEDDEARLISDLREALSDAAFGETIAAVELRELAMNMPAVGRALVTIHRKYRQSIEQAGLLAARLGEDRQSDVPVLPSTPFEEVRDFFYLRHNYIAELDEAAEAIAQAMKFPVGQMDSALAAYLAERHGVKLVVETIDDLPSGNERKYDSKTNTLYLAPGLRPGQSAFQLGTQIAMLAFDRELNSLVDGAGFTSQEARGLARIGLANYFAGALIMPYGRFLAAAEARRYDIELLGYEFGVGFETVCHRLSSLQRQGARGVPFFFVRDVNPNKPNRLLALPRVHGNRPQQLSDMTAEQRSAYWTAAIAKARESWGEDWGIALNSTEKRTQCHLHLHIGKLLPGMEDDKFVAVDGPASLPVPNDGEGIWVHPVSAGLHAHAGEPAGELKLQR